VHLTDLFLGVDMASTVDKYNLRFHSIYSLNKVLVWGLEHEMVSFFHASKPTIGGTVL